MNRNIKTDKKVLKKIADQNHWYCGSHFDWSNSKEVKKIYDQRRLLFLNILMRRYQGSKKLKLLDIGCGDGYWSSFFAHYRNVTVTGIDYNHLRIAKAKNNVPVAKFMVMDLKNKTAMSKLGKFDLIFCSHVIEHVKNDVQLLRDAKHYLHKNGLLILGTTNEGCFTQRYKDRSTTDHIHFYTEKEMKNKLSRSGFDIADIYREVLYPGSDKIFYRLTASEFGFKFLELLTLIFPSQCSDFYFVCRQQDQKYKK